MSALSDLVQLLKQEKKTGTDYTGTVTRVNGKTAYVRLTGSDIMDTPVSLSIDAKVGDTVRVRVANGKAWLTGNDTKPPTHDTEKIEAVDTSLTTRINYLAQQIAEMPMIDSGTIPGGSISAGRYADWEVVFTKPFTVKPTVTVGFMTNSTDGNFGRCCCAVVLSSLKKTGFTLRVYNGDSSGRAPKCNWVAVGR